MKYKVGDNVKIVRIDPKWLDKSLHSPFIKYIGKCTKIIAVVNEIDNDYYLLEIEKQSLWSDIELEYCRSDKLKRILKNE